MIKYLLPILLAVFLTGCGGANYVALPKPPMREEPEGIYHKVQKGETLWRISRMYDVDVEMIASANNLPNKQQINEGQLLFIPQRDAIPQASSKGNSNFIWPLKGKIVSFFGSDKDGVKNKGVDIKARYGEAVVASRGGRVSFADENMKGFGKTIIIDHDDGYSTVYAHNSEILVKVGQGVRRGTVIAKAGQTGRVESVRLHFEIRKKHIPQNPFYFLP